MISGPALVLALLPDFALILMGAALRRLLRLGDHFWNGLEKLVYFVLFPALLFNGLVRTRIDWSAAGPMLYRVAVDFLQGTEGENLVPQSRQAQAGVCRAEDEDEYRGERRQQHGP